MEAIMNDQTPSPFHHRKSSLLSIVFSLVLLLSLPPASGQSAGMDTITFEVDTTIDSNALAYRQCSPLVDGDCSLRGAIILANSLSTDNTYHVDLLPVTYQLSIAGSGENNAYSGDLDILNNIEMHGQSGTVIDGGGLDRVIDHIGPGVLLTISNIIIRNGIISIGEGAGIRSTSSGTLYIFSSTIRNNSDTGSDAGTNLGGGLYDEGGLLWIDHSLFISNHACDGGGIYYKGSSGEVFYLNDSSVNYNTADCDDGTGGLKVTGIGSLDSTGSSISHNTGPRVGGMYSGEDIYLTMESLYVYDNDATVANADYNAGGMMIEGSGSLSKITVVNNQNQGNSGGGISFLFFSDVTVEDALIMDNQTSDRGGGVWVLGKVIFRRVTFTGNQSNQGGGIYILGNLGTTVVALENCTIVNNTAALGGGAIRAFNQYTLSITHSTIQGNIHPNGGAVDIISSTPYMIQSSILSDEAIGSTCDYAFGGSVISYGYNIATDDSCGLDAATDLQSTDPMLGELEEFGDSFISYIVPLLTGSPAIDSGDPADPLIIDQRGWLRMDGDRDNVIIADRGAAEYLAYWWFLPKIFQTGN
jgi:predicted outer membrane repeat protein